jgi:hypothetical protein
MKVKDIYIITEFIGLRSKCYSYILDDESEEKKRGVKELRNVFKK